MKLLHIDKRERFLKMQSLRLFGQNKKYRKLKHIVFDYIFVLWLQVEDTRWKAVCRKYPFLGTDKEEI